MWHIFNIFRFEVWDGMSGGLGIRGLRLELEVGLSFVGMGFGFG